MKLPSYVEIEKIVPSHRFKYNDKNLVCSCSYGPTGNECNDSRLSYYRHLNFVAMEESDPEYTETLFYALEVALFENGMTISRFDHYPMNKPVDEVEVYREHGGFAEGSYAAYLVRIKKIVDHMNQKSGVVV